MMLYHYDSCLLTFFEQNVFDRFQSNSAELEVWIASALANVKLWNNLSGPDPQDSEILLANIMVIIILLTV